MTRIGVERVWVGDRLRDVTLDVPGGSVTAVVGGDGAGKTTLLRLLVGALVPDRGRVFAPDHAEEVGFVPTGAGYYPDLTVDENLRFVGTAYGLRSEVWDRRRDYVLDLTGLGPFTGRLARDLSGGMRQKLALAAGTLHHPRLLVLDEPTTGVDPVSRVDLWRIIANAAAAGVHVVVATSYIDEAERAARVLALHDGTTLLEGRPDELSRSTPGSIGDVDEPSVPELAWRRGAGWRQWTPDGGDAETGVLRAPRLEDAVMVATLAREVSRPGATA